MTAIAAAFATAVHFCQSRCQHPVPLCCQLLPLLHLHCHGSAATSQLRFCCSHGCHQRSLAPHFCSVKANCSSVTAVTCSHPPVQMSKVGEEDHSIKDCYWASCCNAGDRGAQECATWPQNGHMCGQSRASEKNGGLDLDHSRHCFSYNSHSFPLLAHGREMFPFGRDINNYRESLVPAV